jgi:rare lipoprotein A
MSRFETAGIGRSARLLLAIIGAASLAACAQTPVGRQRADLSISRQAAVERRHEFRSAAFHPRLIGHRHHSPTKVAGGRAGSEGVASFYTEGTETASGEKYDMHELTAAHPTLPFGTKLRVTNVSTGRSVTVRVNDRGPYVHGRVVDVSYSAAEALGMVNKGVANVKLDVVQ